MLSYPDEYQVLVWNMIWNRFATHWCNFRCKTWECSSSSEANHPRSCLVNFHTRREEFFQVVCMFRRMNKATTK